MRDESGSKGSDGQLQVKGSDGQLQVDQVKVRGSEMGTQCHVGILQLLEDALVELGAHAVKLHDVTRILLDPEPVEFLHQVTYRKHSDIIKTEGIQDITEGKGNQKYQSSVE
ncbi:hypothetical protein MHYP_G00210800 [Metynnis hypsauchen]